jgi:signal transduction histidine kinase
LLTDAADRLLSGGAERDAESDGIAVGARLALITLWVGPPALIFIAPGLVVSNEPAAVALETVGAAATMVAAWVSVSRFRGAPSAGSRALMVALAFWASYLLLLGMGPALINVFDDQVVDRADDLPALVGAALFAYAAFASWKPARITPPARRMLTVGVVLGVTASALGAGIAATWTNLVGDEVRSGRSGLAHLVSGNGAYMSVQILTAALFSLAGLRFAQRAWRSRSDLATWWLVGALVLSAWTRVAELVGPEPVVAQVSWADVLSAASALALAPWAAYELAEVRRHERELAKKEERSRLARELHDTIAQDLAFIVGESRRLAASLSGQHGLVDINAAAERALEEARSEIYRLRDSGATDLGRAIEAHARLLTARAGLDLRLDITPRIFCSARVQREILAILQEAISNTARHAGASEVGITLGARGDALVLRIWDDGRGFEPQQLTAAGGFGLSSLRERSHALGSVMSVTSSPGAGTTIELAIP